MAVATLGITTNFVIGTTAVAVCATNTLRRGLRIENTSASVPLAFGFATNNAATTFMHAIATSTAISFGPLQPNDTGRISLASNIPLGDLSVISTVTNGAACVTEW